MKVELNLLLVSMVSGALCAACLDTSVGRPEGPAAEANEEVDIEWSFERSTDQPNRDFVETLLDNGAWIDPAVEDTTPGQTTEPGEEPAETTEPEEMIEPETPNEGTEPDDPALDSPLVDPAELVGHWVSALEGSTGTFFDWLTFTTPDALSFLAEQRFYWEPLEIETLSTGSGGFEVSAEGTVSFWHDAERAWGHEEVLQRHSFTVLDPTVVGLFYENDYWPYETPTAGRVWTFGGYLAQDTAHQVFRRDFGFQQSFEGYFDYTGFTTVLTFNQPVGSDEGPCQVRIDIEAEASDESDIIETASESFEMSCDFVTDDRTGLGRIQIDGFDEGTSDWGAYLYELGLADEYPPRLFDQIRRAFGGDVFYQADDTRMVFHAPYVGYGASLMESPLGPETSSLP